MADPTQIRNRIGPDVATFSDQIRKYPVLLSALEVRDCDCFEFGTAKPTAEQYRQHSVISFPRSVVRSKACSRVWP